MKALLSFVFIFSRLEFHLDKYEYVKCLSDRYFCDFTMKTFKLIFNNVEGINLCMFLAKYISFYVPSSCCACTVECVTCY
jgi:hypothetical protein